MQPGDVLADRFVIERLAGAGGMGAVYRAHDRAAACPVAVKVLTGGGATDERFAQEARVLADLVHPAVVRYVAHGATMRGEPWLAMEWLEGEDLAQRLARAGLSVAETVAVGRRIALALAAVHAQGAIHRDVKPSNVFLVGGDPACAKLLDFGVARLAASAYAPTARPVTRTGMLLGTVGYMSPEQATTDTNIDARTDVFALGCVLFECLTGQPAFAGAHGVAILAKVLRGEVPRPQELRPDLPPELGALVSHMLEKDRAARPADGAAVLRALDALGESGGGVLLAGEPPARGLSAAEQRLVTVMLAHLGEETRRALDVVAKNGGEASRLADGALLATWRSSGSTTAQVVSAAACSLDLAAASPAARVALATGRVHTAAGGPPGPVIDRAAALLSDLEPGIRLDEVTAGLLGDRYDVRELDDGALLVGRRVEGELPRTLLGKVTPYLGRDKELGLLEATLRECIDDSVARAVVVTGPAGQGKSRLRHELAARAKARGDVAVWTARADPMGAGSAFNLVRQLVRGALGLREGDEGLSQRGVLGARVADVCPDRDAVRIADFLGELIGLPAADRPSPQLLAARIEPRIMATWLARSFGDWLAGECAARPVLVVLEDLHWGDLPSVTYLGDGLRALAHRPLMVLALARPEVDETFPSLWSGIEAQRVALGRLAPRAAERLCRAVLGDRATPSTVARVVERADGNAFYLEELIRRVAEGSDDALPETVIALVESRLERLEPEARRVIRAASVFGEVSWRGAIAKLVGESGLVGDLDHWLRVLAAQEVLVPVAESRFAGERESAFRHGLLREAAYAMLTEDDRSTGHRLAGEWLLHAGEKNALELADHFEKGGEPARAVPWITRACEEAYEGGNAAAACTLAERGLAMATTDAERGVLKMLEGVSAGTRSDVARALPALRKAATLLPKGERHWFTAVTGLAFFGVFAGDASATIELARSIGDLPAVAARGGLYGWSATRVLLAFIFIGQPERARSFLERIDAAAAIGGEDDLSFAAWRAVAHVMWRLFGPDPDPVTCIVQARRTVALFDAVGDSLSVVNGHFWVSASAAAIGRHDELERSVALGRESAERSSNAFIGRHLELTLWADRVFTRGPDECISAFARLAEDPIPVIALNATAWLAYARARLGDLAGAEETVRRALEAPETLEPPRTVALAVLARTLLLAGRAAESLAAAERCIARPVRSGFDALITPQLSRALALLALGRGPEADDVLRRERARLLGVSNRLEGPDRAAHLGDVEDNARLLALARERLGEPGEPAGP